MFGTQRIGLAQNQPSGNKISNTLRRLAMYVEDCYKFFCFGTLQTFEN